MTKKKPKQALYWLNHGNYPGHTMLIYNYSYDFVVKYLKKIKAQNWLDCVEHEEMLMKKDQWCCMKRTLHNPKTGKDTTLFIIRIGTPFYFNDRAYATLAHEVLHLCQFFLPELLDRNKEIEAEAYFHTYMMEQILDVIRGKK